MELYVVRHGVAEPSGGGTPETKRALTAEGRALLDAAARGLGILAVHPGRILSSPLVRARETAEVLAGHLGDPPVDVLPEIASGAAPGAFFRALQPHAGEPAVAIVGHEPDVGRFSAALLGAAADRPVFPFRPGAVACFEAEVFPRSHQAALRWFLESRHLARLAR